MHDIAGLHHAALSVADLDASTRWYREVLGLEEVFREPGDHRRAVVLALPGAGAVVGLVEHRRDGRAGFDPATIGLDHLAFTIGTRADLEVWAERLTDRGVEHSGVIEIPPGAIVNLKDPDGIALALFWDRPE